MRNEQEMKALILDKAKADERIRADYERITNQS